MRIGFIQIFVGCHICCPIQGENLSEFLIGPMDATLGLDNSQMLRSWSLPKCAVFVVTVCSHNVRMVEVVKSAPF